MAREGEEVWIKVISVKQEEEGNTKIGCSMKYVNQGSGVDADPNNVQLEQQQSRPSWQEPQKVCGCLKASDTIPFLLFSDVVITPVLNS